MTIAQNIVDIWNATESTDPVKKLGYFITFMTNLNADIPIKVDAVRFETVYNCTCADNSIVKITVIQTNDSFTTRCKVG